MTKVKIFEDGKQWKRIHSSYTIDGKKGRRIEITAIEKFIAKESLNLRNFF